MIKQFASFAAVGGVATAAQYVVLVALVHGWDVSPVLASAIGMVIGACVGYSLNYRFTFRSGKRHRDTAPRFFAVAGVGLLLNTVIMSVCTGPLHVYYMIAQVVATGLVLLWNFGVNRMWTFRTPDGYR